jgi:transcriptional antiterminator RfaH
MTLSPEQNPAALYPEDILTGDADKKPWRVAHVKSRREKALAGYLAASGIGYYLPLYQRRQASANRTRHSLLPLFAGYLFLKADDFDRRTALRSNQIARIIDVRDPGQLLDELRAIHKTLTHAPAVYPYDFIAEGRRVRIKKGPLKELTGILVRKDNKYRFIISVTGIFQSAAVTIDAAMVEPAD